MKYAKGINRLGVVTGLILAIWLFVYIFLEDRGFEDVHLTLIACAVVFLVAWGLVRLAAFLWHWVKDGFREDSGA